VLSSEEDRPLFLSWTPYAVHTPIQAPEGEVAAFRERLPDHGQGNARYAGMLASLDRQLGRSLAAHRRLRGGRPLVTILTSDNGGLAPITSMEPLSGWKGMLREGGIRVPLVLHGGPFALEGESCPEPAHHVDLAPTLLALAGVSLPAGLRGRDLARRGALEERPLFWHFPCYLEGRGHAGDPWRARPGGALRLGRWKLLEDFESGQLQLFDLQEDPGEERDLAAAEPETVEDLHGRLVAWRSALGAPMPSGPDPAFVADPEPRARSGAR
jgi:arylsulfatase A-like enzyme